MNRTPVHGECTGSGSGFDCPRNSASDGDRRTCSTADVGTGNAGIQSVSTPLAGDEVSASPDSLAERFEGLALEPSQGAASAEANQVNPSAEDSNSSAEDSDDWESASTTSDDDLVQRTDMEELKYGCQHYRRKCKIIAPCCNEVFWCRYCHNGDGNEQNHQLDRKAVQEVECAMCGCRQPVSNRCESCGIEFGAYFCSECKFWDDQGEAKGAYHCDKCQICRVGGRENFFHCDKCGSCYSLGLQGNHRCVPDALSRPCPICLDDLFESRKPSRVLPCGHAMHGVRAKGLLFCLGSLCEKNHLAVPETRRLVSYKGVDIRGVLNPR